MGQWVIIIYRDYHPYVCMMILYYYDDELRFMNVYLVCVHWVHDVRSIILLLDTARKTKAEAMLSVSGNW